jgi:hypothetical protein
MLEYDQATGMILVAFGESCSLLNMEQTEDSGDELESVFNLEDEIGGIGFLNSGLRCVISAPGLSTL